MAKSRSNCSFFENSFKTIGNLTKDNSQGIQNIKWNLQNKILEINKTSGQLYFTYYYPNGKINSLFRCDYKKDCDCVLKTYSKNGEIWFLYVWRPLNFVKIDSLRGTKLPLSDVKKKLFSVGPNKIFRSNGSVEEEIFFKYGLVNKVVEYGIDGSKIITQYDDKGNPIENK